MKLYLVRHGDALQKEIDPNRGLSKRGKEDVNYIAEFLSGRSVKVNRIEHSGKKRAEETARLFSSCLASEGTITGRKGIAPLDPIKAVVVEVEGWNEDVMLVGHLPFMGKLVSMLVTGDEDVSLVSFQPGSVVCLERDKESHWTIVWMIRPELL